MKLHILSDLHSEFEDYDYNETDSDVVVLAGDTNIKERGIAWALDTIKEKPLFILWEIMNTTEVLILSWRTH